MRYIDEDNARLRVEPAWREGAEQAAEALAAASDGDRARLLEESAPIWREVKRLLLEVSHGKCWYCETKQDRAECDVEHYRPKGRVHGCPKHPGYYWLATRLGNLRVSCQFCNRVGSAKTRSEAGGKGDHFPLTNEDSRAYLPSDPVDLENPLLLDPTDVDDPQLLWIDDDGRVAPNPLLAPDGSLERTRVETTIRLLNLNEERLREARLGRRLEAGRAERMAQTVDVDEVKRDRVRWLIRAARGDAEYSLAVRCLLRSEDTGEGSLARLILEQM